MSDAGAKGETWTTLRHLVLLVALVSAAWFQGSHLEDKSPTEDEWAHLIRGMNYWHGDDMRLQYAHPPLSNMITALPLAFDDDVPDFSELDGWEIARVGKVAYSYISTDYEAARAKLMRARHSLIWIHAIGILYLYFWGWRTFSWRAGAAGALLFALHPTILGQARYVTTDLAAGVTAIIAVGEFARHLRGRGKWTSWLTLPLALSAAVLAKHSGLLLVILFVAVSLGACWRSRAIYRGLDKRERYKSWLKHTAFTAAVVVLAINVVYKFDSTGMTVQEVLEKPEPQYWVSESYYQYMLERRSPMGVMPDSLPLPVPYTWMFGVTAVGVQSKIGFAWASFFGFRTPGGHFLYFPVMVLLKTPFTILALVGFAAYFFWKRGKLPPELLTVALVFTGFMFFAMRSRINMGIRHALPLVALLVMWSAAGFHCALERWKSPVMQRRISSAAFGLIAISALVHRADYLGYFNIGRDLGHQVSVVGDDWGQDRAGFAEASEQLGIQPLYYDSQTATRDLESRHVGLEYFELDCETDIPGAVFVAIHATRALKVSEECLPDLIGREPIYHFNHHILVYWIPRKPKPEAETPPADSKGEGKKRNRGKKRNKGKRKRKRKKRNKNGRSTAPASVPPAAKSEPLK